MKRKFLVLCMIFMLVSLCSCTNSQVEYKFIDDVPHVSFDGGNNWYKLLTDDSVVTIKGEKGDKGDTGSTGKQGETGATGAKGATGPQGDKGDPGQDGIGIEKIEYNSNNELIVYYSNDTSKISEQLIFLLILIIMN